MAKPNMGDSANDDFKTLLSALLGANAIIEDKQMMVVEIIHTGPLVVLSETLNSQGHFQQNQYGESGRKVGVTYTLSLWNDTKTGLHPLLKTLLDADVLEALETFKPK